MIIIYRMMCDEALALAQATLSSIGEGVISTNMDHKIIYMNEMAESILEISASQATGKDFDQIVRLWNVQSRIEIESPLKDVLNGEKIKGLKNNTIIRTDKGHEKYISATFSPIVDQKSVVKGAVVIIRDITRLKNLEIENLNEKNNLKEIFDYAAVGMVVLDRDYIITQINDTALVYLEQSRENIVGNFYGNSFPCVSRIYNYQCGKEPQCAYCEFRRAVRRAIEEGIETGSIEQKKAVVCNGLEEEHWFRISTAPLLINSSKYCLVTMIDITENKNKEKEITDARDTCKNILDQLPSLIWRTDTEFACTYANKVWLDFYGKSLEEALDFGWYESIHPDDLPRYNEIREKAMKNQEYFQPEIRIRGKDGAYYWCIVAHAPYYNLNGKFEGYLASILNIQEQKEAEENRERYRMIFDNARDIVIMMDLNGRILEANKSAIETYGYLKDELIGMDINKIWLNSTAIREQIKKSVQKQIFLEAVHRRKDGSIFVSEVSTQLINIGEKQILFSIIRDITERKRAEEELHVSRERAEAANRAKSQFLASMSHEIRTPINGMTGMIDLTLLTELTKEQRENLITAKACADSLLNIINDVLDFSKMEAGKLSIDEKNFDLKELTEELLKPYTLRVKEKGLFLKYTVPDNIPRYLVGDPGRLRQIIDNLMGNAVKFTNQGFINFEISKTSEADGIVELLFRISDTGIGISEDNISSLFTSFHQVESSFTKKYGGTGLGLAIAKRLVEMMGGSIGVESSKGNGSSFYFFLKFKEGNLAVSTERKAPETKKTDNPLMILLVEDDEVNRKVISKMLKERGHRVEFAYNGKEAVDLFQMKKYDIILMDIQMPEMNGVEAVKNIRIKEKSGSHIPIIALTAYALKGDEENFLKAGMDGYLSKPINMSGLYEEIEKSCYPRGARLDSNGEVRYCTYSNRNEVAHKTEELLKKIPLKIIELDHAMEEQNFNRIERIAHQIKEQAIEADFINLKDFCFKLELSARKEEMDTVKKYFLEMKEEYYYIKQRFV